MGKVGIKEVPQSQMEKALKRTVFVGSFRHAVDSKKRVAVPAKWRAAASGTREFYVLPDPQNCLFVLPESEMGKLAERASEISIGEYERRDVLRLIASQAHASPCDKQGRITLTEDLLRYAGIGGEAVLVGAISKFEIWSPDRLAANTQSVASTLAEAAKQLGM